MRLVTRRFVCVASSIVLIALAAVALLASQTSLIAFGADAPSSGVKLKIVAASIPADLIPEVTFTLTDASGGPLRVADADTGGLRFMIGAIATDPATKNTRVVNYTVNRVNGNQFQFAGSATQPALTSASQAAVDNGGTFNDLGNGRFMYKFKTAVPADFNAGITHTVAGYATRNARAFVSNDAFYFVPAGGPVEVMREVVTTASCNACHVDLAAHGGTRRDTRVCVLCHTDQTTDPESGNTVDFKVMVHKIHSGANLPSVEDGGTYFITGNSLRVFDFSEIRWTQDTRNCQTCHQGAQASNYKTRPSAEACGSCHDSVNFTTGANHAAGPQPNTACATCHPGDGPEFGLSVAGTHTIPQKSKQLRGVNFEIVSFTNTKPGQNPTVVFNIKDNAGQSIQPSEMTSLAFVLSGPTYDYASPPVTENALAASKPDGAGNFSYTFVAKIPDNAAGTYAVGIQGALAQVILDPSGKPVGSGAVSDVGFNKVAYGAVTDAVPMPRKEVVDIKNCNVCHDTLALHGGTRRSAEFCVLCHNPVATDSGKRATAKGPMPPESVSFGPMIHKIHTGADLENRPYIIYGGSPANPGPIDMSEGRFPTDVRNCTKCHLPGSNLLTFMREEAQPVVVKQGNTVFSTTPPVQSVCMGCHDSKEAKAHADTQTLNGVETCTICHNEGRDFAVSEAHGR